MDLLAHLHTSSRRVAKLSTCNTCVTTERTNLTARVTNDVVARSWTGFSRDDVNSERIESRVCVPLPLSPHICPCGATLSYVSRMQPLKRRSEDRLSCGLFSQPLRTKFSLSSPLPWGTTIPRSTAASNGCIAHSGMIDESLWSMVGIITKENWNFRWETYPWTTLSIIDPTCIFLGFKPNLLSEISATK